VPVRAVIFLSLGPPFGGFRIAGRPGLFGLDNPRAFQTLERSIEGTYTLLSAHRPADWMGIAQTETGFEAAAPRLGERTGFVDCTGDAMTDETGKVILRACFPFRWWPLGGWVVYEGRHRALDGTWTPFTADELAKLW